MTQTAHFGPSFFTPIPALSLHLGEIKPKNSLLSDYFSLGIENDKLHYFPNAGNLPQGVNTDLRKIQQFVFDHLGELQTVPLQEKDNPVRRVMTYINPVEFLIKKHNLHVEESLSIRVLSIFLLIITLGIYNYQKSLLIDSVMKGFAKGGHALLVKRIDDFLASQNMPEEERLFKEQQVLTLLSNRSELKAFCDQNPGLLAICSLYQKENPHPSWIEEIKTIAKRDGFVAFYRSGPTASFSPFAENENGIRIYGKKFSCIISAFEYKRCEAAGCSNQELEKFPSLSGDEALSYGKTLTEKKAMPTNWLDNRIPTMEEIVQAKYGQDRELYTALNATDDADLIYHMPKEAKEGFWSDWGNGEGRNEFGAILERTRAFITGVPQTKQSPAQQKLLHHAGSATNLLYKIGDD